MTVVRRIRSILSWPLLAFQLLIFGLAMVSWALQWVLGFVNAHLRIHVYYVTRVGRRLVAGEPAFQFEDLRIGMQPIGKRARALADADPRVMKIDCPCNGKFCPGVRYVPRMPPGDMMTVPLGALLDPEIGHQIARDLAGKIREQLAATHPRAAAAVDDAEIDGMEARALKGEAVPAAEVLRVIERLRGLPIVVKPPMVPGAEFSDLEVPPPRD